MIYNLQLIRRMRSTCHPFTWKLMSDLNLVIHDLYNCNNNTYINANVTRMTKMLTDFLANTPKDGADRSEEYLQMFIHSSIPAAQILFTNPTTVYRQFSPILFKFCTILRGDVGVDDTLYIFCRSCLAAMMKGNVHDVKRVLRLTDVFPLVHELVTRLSHALEFSMQLAEFIQLSESDSAIRLQKAYDSPVSFRSLMQDEAGNERCEIKGVHHVFYDLLEKSEYEPIVGYWSEYLLTIKELESISKLYKGLKEMFWEKMRQKRVALCFLIATGPGMLRAWFSLVCEAIFNLQISIVFDCVFFLHLAGEDISFEDTKDADPYLYSGCKKILEMDTKMVDEDILGLTFVCEDEGLGSRKVVELCPNGKNMLVNSENRDNYVNLLIKHHFVTSIAHQILDHEDLNMMLHGSKTTISVEDWKEHKNYNDSKLQIYRTSVSHDCFPSSHTCFYHLCFPPYPSMDAMQNCLNIITQNYVGCCFGVE
ncbi:hypothetical protein R3W88_024243 [Solanum pinnatisectum]|uniref:HECT-type E3 ubiquitin transferase n=1 Tax=Solanum pinnatisectum TaxID=50273 RepID=A0AAV9M333_9SOLN|nr:hypothetical protein R3W88_024243 [Solanum pinnatisectum]